MRTQYCKNLKSQESINCISHFFSLMLSLSLGGCVFDTSGLPPTPTQTYECTGTVWQYNISTKDPTFAVTRKVSWPEPAPKTPVWEYFGYNRPGYYAPKQIPPLLYLGSNSHTVEGSIPTGVKGSHLLRVDVGDKYETSTSNYLELRIEQAEVDHVWIAFDKSAIDLPLWLKNDFEPLPRDPNDTPNPKDPNESRAVIDTTAKANFVVYKPRDWESMKTRTLYLGGNNALGVKWPTSNPGAQYLVLVRMKPRPDTSLKMYDLGKASADLQEPDLSWITSSDLEQASKRAMTDWLLKPANAKYKESYQGGWVNIELSQSDCTLKCGTPDTWGTNCKKTPLLNGDTTIVNTWVEQSDAQIDEVKSTAKIEIPGKGSASTNARGSLKFRINEESNVEIGSVTLIGKKVKLSDGTNVTEISIGQAQTIVAQCADGLPPGPFRICGTYIIAGGPNPGFKAAASAKVNGRSLTLKLENDKPITLKIDHTSMSFNMTGGPIAGSFKVNGKLITVLISIDIEGYFTSLAPVASAAETKREWECQDGGNALVTLSASASFDDLHPGTIVSYRWIEDAGYHSETLLGTKQTISVPMAYGAHDITLYVTDIDGITGSESFRVNVLDSKIDDISVPNDIWVIRQNSAGASVSVGTASASDYCSGAVDISNDAPQNGFFAPGLTIVTWRFDDYRGNIQYHKQKVFVLDAAYSPAPIASAFVSKPHLLTGDKQDLIVETYSQGLAVTADQYVMLRFEDSEVISFDEFNQFQPGAIMPHAVNKTFGASPTSELVFSDIFSNYFPAEGLYTLETYLVKPGGSPQVAEDIIGYGSFEFYLEDPK